MRVRTRNDGRTWARTRKYRVRPANMTRKKWQSLGKRTRQILKETL